jgi:hypothetical protein
MRSEVLLLQQQRLVEWWCLIRAPDFGAEAEKALNESRTGPMLLFSTFHPSLVGGESLVIAYIVCIHCAQSPCARLLSPVLCRLADRSDTFPHCLADAISFNTMRTPPNNMVCPIRKYVAEGYRRLT